MPADIVNLNRFRKARARDDKAKQAEENRVTFGRSKAEKQQAAADAALTAKRLDGVKRVDTLPGTPPQSLGRDPDRE